jgi:hypothetical protein
MKTFDLSSPLQYVRIMRLFREEIEMIDESVNVKIDLRGQSFEGWAVVGEPIRKNKRTYWPCRCKCGREKLVESYNLTSGRARMCRPCSAKLAGVLMANGNPKSWLYSRWQGIKTRCYNAKQPSYIYYGGLGIGVYEPWRDDFKLFHDWVLCNLGLPAPYQTLDRIDGTKNYEPGNLRWASPAEQQENRGWAVSQYKALWAIYG